MAQNIILKKNCELSKRNCYLHKLKMSMLFFMFYILSWLVFDCSTIVLRSHHFCFPACRIKLICLQISFSIETAWILIIS